MRKNDYYHVKMPKEDNKISNYNPAPFIIITKLECILPKTGSCQNNAEKSYTEEKPSMSLQVTHGLYAVHQLHEKKNEVVTEKKTAWQNFLKI